MCHRSENTYKTLLVPDNCLVLTRHLAQVVKFLICNFQAPSLNISWIANHPDWDLLWLASVPPGGLEYNNVNDSWPLSSQLLPGLLNNSISSYHLMLSNHSSWYSVFTNLQSIHSVLHSLHIQLWVVKELNSSLLLHLPSYKKTLPITWPPFTISNFQKNTYREHV